MTISREDAADLCMKAGYIRTDDPDFTAFVIRLITLAKAEAFEEAANWVGAQSWGEGKEGRLEDEIRKLK